MQKQVTSTKEDFSTIIVENFDDRAIVTLNRPSKRNAIDQDMLEELHIVCAALERSPRILIITGRAATADGPGFFAAGADIAQLRERRRDDALAGMNSSLFTRIASLPMPVIAAVDGSALGGGAELALAADFRIATVRTRIGNPESGLGILAAAGASWRIKELAGEQIALEMLLASRILSGDEALRAGIVSRVVSDSELLEAAHELADTILANDSLAVRITKQVLRAPRSAHPAMDNLAQAVLFESQAKFERMDAFLGRDERNDD